MKAQSRKVGLVHLGLALSLIASGCGSNSSTSSSEDSSASGAAAGAVGGALSGSSSSGVMAFLNEPAFRPSMLASLKNELSLFPSAVAGSSCPTFKTASGSGCTASSGTMWLTYSDCSFNGSAATWNGTQALINSGGTATCGSFPLPGNGQTLTRQLVEGHSGGAATTPSSATVTSKFGVTATIDDATNNLGTFDGSSVSYITSGNSGYGSQVTFGASGARTNIDFAHHLYVTGAFDHSLYTPSPGLTVSESAGATSRTVSGTVTLYHNLLRVIATSQINVTHTNGCCFPTSGTVTTSFAASTNSSYPPTRAGEKYVGQTETLQLTGCGTGTLTAVDGTQTDVTLTRCF